jgi:hypothetical protein
MRAKDVVRMFWLVDVDLCASRTPLFMRCVVYARVGDGLCDLGSGGGSCGILQRFFGVKEKRSKDAKITYAGSINAPQTGQRKGTFPSKSSHRIRTNY